MFPLTHLSDKELLQLLQKADEAAFAEIFSRYWEKLSSYSIGLTKSEEESADIVQEIFISLWNRREILVINGSLAAYLIKSAKNLSLRYIQRSVQPTEFIEKLAEFIADNSQDIEENISVKELQLEIDNAIAKIPKKMLVIYMLSRDEQLSYREISEKLNISEGTVKKQISNALKIISTSLKGKLSVFTYALILQFLK